MPIFVGHDLSVSTKRQIGPAMTSPPEAPLVGADVSIARLHGEACIDCGAVNTKLYPAGAVSTRVDGGLQVWQANL